MQLVPVIDLMQGQVVRGVRGERLAYRPIVSALCRSSEPVTVARILAGYCAASDLYVADLDALQGGAPQLDVLRQMLEALPDLSLWLDAGFADADAAARLLAGLGPLAGRVLPVFASESLLSAEAVAHCFQPGRPGLLSLDRRDGRPMDPAGLWARPALWPERVIVMTLERVGSGAGPDLQTLREVAALCPQARLIGAGGIASEADLLSAEAAGASAWLVASALHDLRLARAGHEKESLFPWGMPHHVSCHPHGWGRAFEGRRKRDTVSSLPASARAGRGRHGRLCGGTSLACSPGHDRKSR